MTLVPVAIFWLLAVWALLSPRPVLLYLFFASMPFGAMAVIPAEFTAGLTLTPTPVVALLIIGRALFTRSGPDFFLASALRINRLGLLFLFWVVAILATLFMPRLFAGEVMVVPLRGEINEVSPLLPSAQNISQLLYLSISILLVFAFARILRSPLDRQRALQAMVFGGFVAVITGLLDFATQFVPIEFLLEPFRTGTYALVTGVEVLGATRVIGLMPEASSFGGVCLAFLSALVFFRRVITDPRTRNVHAPVIIMLLLGCCYISTSSGTYVGVAVLACAMLADAMFRLFARGGTRRLHRRDQVGELIAVFGFLLVAASAALFSPGIVEPVVEMVDKMVLQKTESDSYEGRGMWRSVALQGIVDTYGLGVGVGGTRSSSSLVAIFSGTGVLGGLLYCAFLLQTLLRRSAHMDWEGQFILTAFRYSILPSFILSLVVGGIDFGAMLAFGYGIVTATVFSSANQAAWRQRRKRAMRERGVAGQPLAGASPRYLLPGPGPGPGAGQRSA